VFCDAVCKLKKRKESKKVQCSICGQELIFKRGKGWVHADGGLVMKYCPACGWKGSSPVFLICPVCGYPLRDDHVAVPDYEKGGGK